MKYTVFKCDCCGKTFCSEYYTGGYIDHYINFAENFDDWAEKDDADYTFHREIVWDGNKLRRKMDIAVRFECFSKYCEKNHLNDLFVAVKSDVQKHLEHLKELDDIRSQIKKLTDSLSYGERIYVGLEG